MIKKQKQNIEFLKWFGPVLDALKDLGGSAKPKEVTQWIAEKLNLPDKVVYERYEKSNGLKFNNQVAFARQYLVWEALLSDSKFGVWTLTNKGWNTKLDYDQAHAIFIKWVRHFAEIRRKKEKTTGDDLIGLQEKAEQEGSSTNIQPSLIEILQNLSPRGFEQLCGRLLREYNFENIQITQYAHDGGIDGFATLKINPFVNISVYFQCKKYSGTVPVSHVQAFIGVMAINKRSVEKGLFISTGTFTKAALEIERNNVQLELIDGDKLVEMFEKIELGVTPKIVYEPDMTFFEQYREK
jgi:restriction system protein